jgi:putative membrane protein
VDLLAHLGPHGGGFGWFGMFRLLFWVLVIAGLFFLLRRPPGEKDEERTDGESVLAERYAKGEISEDEYRQRLTVLRESRR